MKVSAVVTTFQSAAELRRCLRSLAWVDELIVVDGGSTDRSVAIAEETGARILHCDNPRMLNQNKNHGFDAAQGPWILSIDSDEELPPALACEIRTRIAAAAGEAGFWLPRQHLLLGRRLRHGPWGADRQLRLFRKDRGRFACEDIHEYLELDGPTESLQRALLHHRPSTLSAYRRRVLHYSRHRARRYFDEGRPFRVWKLFGGPARAVIEPLILRGGLRDGLAGLFLAGMLGLESLCDHLYHLKLLAGGRCGS